MKITDFFTNLISKPQLFPIIGNDGSQLLNIEGERSYIYELLSPDLYQFNKRKLTSYYQNLESYLNNVDEGGWYKIFYLKNKAYLESKIQLNSFLGIETSIIGSPMNLFFGENHFNSNICFEEDYVRLNGKYLRIISLLEYPSTVEPNQFCEFGDYIICFRKNSLEMTKLKLESARQGHLVSFTKVKKDIEGEAAYQTIQKHLEDVIKGNSRDFDVEIFFLVESENYSELNKKTESLISRLKLIDAEGFIEGNNLLKLKVGLSDYFTRLIPGGLSPRGIKANPCPTGILAYSLPLKRHFIHEKGIKFHSQDESEEIFIDYFDEMLKSKNIIISGETGSGKSVLAIYLMKSLLDTYPDTSFVILDKEASYSKIVLYYEGINYSGKFNPFQFKDPDYLKIFLLSLMGEDKLSQKDEGRLFQNIVRILKEDKAKTFKEFIDELEKEFNGIQYYCAQLMDFVSDEVIEVFPRITYLDLKNYPEKIVKSVIIFMNQYFNNLKTLKKVLIADEYKAYQGSDSLSIEWRYRSIRKTGGACWSLCQKRTDFLRVGETSNGITENVYFIFNFPQKTEDDEFYDDFDSMNIKSLRFKKNVLSDCYLITSDKKIKKSLTIKLNKMEKILANSEIAFNEAFFKFYEKNREFFQSNKKCIEAYARLISYE